MNDHGERPDPFGWTHAGTARRQREAGLRMAPAQRLAWLEETLDELLPLLGRARKLEQERHANRNGGDAS